MSALAGLLALAALLQTTSATEGRLDAILQGNHARLASVLDRSEELRLQILLATVVERDGEPPRLQRSGWRVDAEYFYPASAIKLCAAVAALEELSAGLAEWRPDPAGDPLSGEWSAPPPEALLDAPLRLQPVQPGDPVREGDATNLAGGAITLRHEIRKLCLVSDNEAFNRLYDLVGQRALNERMWAAGLGSTRLRHRLSVRLSEAQNRRTPRVELLLGEARRVWPERASELELDVPPLSGLDVGRAFREDDGQLLDGPVSFRGKNRISLVDLQDALVKVVRPDVDLGTPGFALGEERRELLLEAMTQLPRESANPAYDPEPYPDDYVKFLLPGLRRVLAPERVRVTNKVGRAYGFSVENAWVRDVGSGRSFFVTAVLYTNANGVLNDGVYEYATLADPFLADLGEVLARELLLDPGGE